MLTVRVDGEVEPNGPVDRNPRTTTRLTRPAGFEDLLMREMDDIRTTVRRLSERLEELEHELAEGRAEASEG